MQTIQDTRLHIAVCDDEREDLQQIMDMTRGIMEEEGVDCALFSFGSGSALYAAIQGGARFQILLLDVMMEGLDGMALASVLREQGDNTAIIFISSNRDMALQGYEVSAVRYLAKPLRRPMLREALQYCCKMCFGKKEILLPTVRGQRRIPLSDIFYAEAMRRVTRLALVDRTEEIALKFSDLFALLPERHFVLCHRSYLVNLKYIGYVRTREIELINGEVLPVSKYRLEDLKKRLVDYNV